MMFVFALGQIINGISIEIESTYIFSLDAEDVKIQSIKSNIIGITSFGVESTPKF